MSTSTDQAPEERVQLIQLVGMPSPRRMLASLAATAVFIVGTLGPLGAWYLNNRLDATEAKLGETLTKALSPVNQRQTEFKMVVSLLVSKSTELTPEEKQAYSNLLSKISYQDVKSVLQAQPTHAEKKSLNQLIRDKEVEQIGKTSTGLVWDGNHPAQVKYVKVKNPDLDLSKIDLVSDGDNSPCRSKVLQSTETSDATVQVCEAHLDSDRRLEFVVIMKP